MANWPSYTFAPRLRGGCLPFGEARGGVFARSELPHPCHVLLSRCKGNTFPFIYESQLYPKWKTPPASWCHSSSSSCCFRSCKCGLQGSGIHFLSSQIFSRSSRKRFDKMSFGATKMPGCGLAFSIYAPRGIRRLRAPHSFTPAATRLPPGAAGGRPPDPLPSASPPRFGTYRFSVV